VKIQELRSMLSEAEADDVLLVLSSVMGGSQLAVTAERFAAVGCTALIITKLDEATGLGHLLPLVDRCGLPLSYVTNGQRVPDDIAVADARQLAATMLGVNSE
jgi:flagellar biosynthesis protein FlhF